MDNQKDENEKIDLSEFPLERKEPVSGSKKSFDLKGFWGKTDKKNQVYIIIIIISFILMVIFLGLFLSKKSSSEGNIAPEYAPPAEENI